MYDLLVHWFKILGGHMAIPRRLGTAKVAYGKVSSVRGWQGEGKDFRLQCLCGCVAFKCADRNSAAVKAFLCDSTCACLARVIVNKSTFKDSDAKMRDEVKEGNACLLKIERGRRDVAPFETSGSTGHKLRHWRPSNITKWAERKRTFLR